MGRLKIKNRKKKSLDQHVKELAMLQVKKQELTDQIFRQAEKKLDDVTSVFYMAYFCLALHREFGFGQKRLARILEALDALDSDLCGKSVDEMRDLALKECKVWLGTEDELKKLGYK